MDIKGVTRLIVTSKTMLSQFTIMAPIRVALVGLSASAKVTWAADAHLPYLLSSQGKLHYELVALLNSSVQAAESAKTTFKLPGNVKAYGDPSKLATDPDIDLVVVNTRVDVHFPVVEPSVRAGKGVFIEWPLTENLAKAIELTQGKSYPNSIVGLQGRVAPHPATQGDTSKRHHWKGAQ